MISRVRTCNSKDINLEPLDSSHITNVTMTGENYQYPSLFASTVCFLDISIFSGPIKSSFSSRHGSIISPSISTNFPP